VEYLLPDNTTDLEGRLVDPSEVLGPKRQKVKLGLERIIVPEVLFDPGRIHLHQAGLPEAVAQSIATLPDELQASAFQNILVVGGSSRFPGLVNRLRKSLQTWAPQDCEIHVIDGSSDLNSAWRGACIFADNQFAQHAVSKHEYEEFGSSVAVLRKRNGGWVKEG